MDEMPMPGGWSMSMMWMRMPGQSWLDAAASFLAMWTPMMAVMMAPVLAPMLWRYRRAVSAERTRLALLTTIAAAGYLFVWAVLGLAIFPLGAAIAAITMQLPTASRAVPLASSLVILVAGAMQFTAWKQRRLACCREIPTAGLVLRADVGTAWREGLSLGLHCMYCCAGLTTILLTLGVMNLWAMALATLAITAERIGPHAERVAKMIGAVAVTAGLGLIARAAAVWFALLAPAP